MRFATIVRRRTSTTFKCINLTFIRYLLFPQSGNEVMTITLLLMWPSFNKIEEKIKTTCVWGPLNLIPRQPANNVFILTLYHNNCERQRTELEVCRTQENHVRYTNNMQSADSIQPRQFLALIFLSYDSRQKQLYHKGLFVACCEELRAYIEGIYGSLEKVELL